MAKEVLTDKNGNPLPKQLQQHRDIAKFKRDNTPADKEAIISRMGDKRNTNGFAQNPQNAGRKKKNKLVEIIEDLMGDVTPVTPNDIMLAQQMLISLSKKQMLNIVDDPDPDKYPVAVVALVNSLLNAMKTGNEKPVMTIIERIAGRAPQEVKFDGNITQQILDFSKVDTKELELLKNIIQKCKTDENPE